MVRMVVVVMMRVGHVVQRADRRVQLHVELGVEFVLVQERVHLLDQAVDGGGVVADDDDAADAGDAAVQAAEAPPQRAEVLAVDDINDVEEALARRGLPRAVVEDTRVERGRLTEPPSTLPASSQSLKMLFRPQPALRDGGPIGQKVTG